MAPKSSSNAKETLIGEDEEVLQAVILADSFNKRFTPLTSRRPRCLLPICNAPLLDWTFESLALAGVQEIFVICRSYSELVKEAIKNSKWSNPSLGLKIVPIVTAKETYSPGDAMRDIYTHGIITSDFVLVSGDLVSSIRIDEAVRVHKERRKMNKDVIMTMVVKESGSRHRTRSRAESSVFVLDAETSECLHYEPVVGYPPTKYAKIPREILEEHPELEIRNDLIDCQIDVCSVEVPSLFQDNFDYGDIRKDFVHGVLRSDLLMKNVYCYVAKEGYAARVKDTKSYASVSKDIISRWTFPLVPDDNHPSGHSYEHLRGNKYIARDSVILSRTCKIGNNTLIGSYTQIYDRAQVISSVVGQRCIIASGAIVRNSYIFDGTMIGAGSVIDQSIVGAGVRVGDKSTLAKGCLIADGVILGSGAKLSPYDRVSIAPGQGNSSKAEARGEDTEEDEEEMDSELEDFEFDHENMSAVLGKDSNAIVWPQKGPDEDEGNSDEEDGEGFNNFRLMRLGDECSDLELSDMGSVTESEDGDSSDDDSDASAFINASSSATSLPTTAIPDLVESADAAAEAEFRSEVKASLARAFAEGHSVDNAAVELKTLRMASNVPLERVKEAVIGSILHQIPIVEGALEQRREIARVIGRWGMLINQIGGIDAVETISILQTQSAGSDRNPLFGQVLAALYQEDVVEEDDIRKWHKMPSSRGVGLEPGPRLDDIKKCWQVGKRMIEQFDEQESSDEDEDSDEDDDSDEDTKKGASSAAKAESSSDEEGSSEEEVGKSTPMVSSHKNQAGPARPVQLIKPASDEDGEKSSSEDGGENFTSATPSVVDDDHLASTIIPPAPGATSLSVVERRPQVTKTMTSTPVSPATQRSEVTTSEEDNASDDDFSSVPASSAHASPAPRAHSLLSTVTYASEVQTAPIPIPVPPSLAEKQPAAAVASPSLTATPSTPSTMPSSVHTNDDA